MPTEEKIKMVEELADKLARARMVVLTDYRGLTVASQAALRAQLRGAQVEYAVTKNTLLLRAAHRHGLGAIEPHLSGPTAVAFCYGDDITAPARILNDFVRTSRILVIKIGLLDGQLLGAEEVVRLAMLPPRERLQVELIGSVIGPLAGFVGLLNGVLASLVRTLDARSQQVRGDAAA